MDERWVNNVVEKETIKAVNQEVTKQITSIHSLIQTIKSEIDKLKQLEMLNLIRNENKQKAQRFLKDLDEKSLSEYERAQSLDTAQKHQYIQIITNLYFFTEQFLVQTGVIKESRFLMTYVSNGMYIRQDLGKILQSNPSQFLEINRESGSSTFGLRFKASSVSQQLLNSIKDNEKEIKKAQELYAHFNLFTRPYWTYHQHNTTGWKINKGVAREAFERHLESLHANLDTETSLQNCRMENVGKRWVMYRESSGSDPYFTGPDTLLSQVKAENASLISNVDTVINTALFILQYEKKAIDIQELEKRVNTSSSLKNFSKDLWMGLSDTVKNQIETELGAVARIGKKQVSFIKNQKI